MARLFFSYAHEDVDKVQRVKSALEQRGHEIWLDNTDIQVGRSIPQAIQTGINNCDFLVVFLTKNAERSLWVKKELANFLMRDNEDKMDRILPLKFEECRITDFGALLTDSRWADFTSDEQFDNNIEQIAQRISSTKLIQQEFSLGDYERMLFAIDLAIRAGNTAMMFYNSSIKENFSLDERKNAATEADETAQTRVISQIKSERLYERDVIVGEEEPFCHAQVATSGYTWVIDPLDGTNNFVSRIPMFCSAIGILKDGKPFIGVLYDPVSNEVYYGMTGMRSQLWQLSTGESSYIAVDAATTEPRKALLGTHISSRPDIAEKLFESDFLLRLSKRFKHVRMLGCGQLALAWVASGRLHAFFQIDTHLWDQVAGLVILVNAGGLVKDSSDRLTPWTFRTRSLVVAANQSIEDAIAYEMGNIQAPDEPGNAEQEHPADAPKARAADA